MDSKVKYALLGGAALIGAAIAFHVLGKQEDPIDDDIGQLGPVEREDNGMLKFEYFLKILEISSFYGKDQFNAKKKEYIQQRRDALDRGDDKEYEMIVSKMTQEEELLVQSKLMDIIEKIGLSEMEFQRTTQYHGSNQMKSMQIM